jgi:Fe-S-cluster containining protein
MLDRDQELTALCQSCGLCCDGSLFGRVRLEPGEVEPARRHRLLVVANARSFEEPCTALVKRDARHHCSIYAERPESCRRFVCALYAGHVREPGSLDARVAVVRRAKALLAFLRSAGLRFGEEDEPAWDDEGSNPRNEAWMPVARELTQILHVYFGRAKAGGQSSEKEESPTSVPLVAKCRIVGPMGSRRRRPHVADGSGARVERIERGVGRPLAPPLEPPGHGGNRRGSAKHTRASSPLAGDATSLLETVPS